MNTDQLTEREKYIPPRYRWKNPYKETKRDIEKREKRDKENSNTLWNKVHKTYNKYDW